MNTETLTVTPLPDYEPRGARIAYEILARAKRFEFAGTAFTARHWMDMETRLFRFTEDEGVLRVLLWPDPERTSPEAIAGLLKLKGAEVRFGRGEPRFGTTDFLITDKKDLTVLASNLRMLYPDECGDTEGGGMVKHPRVERDEAARRVRERFEACWVEARRVDEAACAEFRSQAQAVRPQYHEGDLIRSLNEMHRPLGTGRIQKIKMGYGKVEFNPSIFLEPPYRSENRMLLLDEIERLETPLQRAERGQWDAAERFEMKVLAARFLTGNKGGQLSNARTEILPHQIFTAHRVVTSPKRRFLLADEVGLGKTIEAGMIWQALAQRGQAKRTLIITPAGLTTQWQEEMQDKFGTFFEIYGRDFQSANPLIWNYKVNSIASIDKLKRAVDKRILLENRKWDLIIFDEAHKLSAVTYDSGKFDSTQNYRLAEELRDKQYCEALLLLTATPHQGDENHSRFINLVSLLANDISFDDLYSPGLFAGRGPSFTDYVIRTPKKDVTDAQGHKVFRGRQTHRLEVKLSAAEKKFYDAVAQYIRGGYRALERIGDPNRKRAAGFLLTTFQKLNASSTAAIKSSLAGRLGRLEGRLNEIPDESIDEDRLIDERYEGEEEEHRVLLDEEAILEHECETLRELLGMQVPRDRKLAELLGLIDHIEKESPRGAEEKVLIFTEYRETQQFLVQALEEDYGKGSVVVIHGGMKLDRREENEQELDVIWAPFEKEGAVTAPTTKRTSQRLFRDHARVRFLVSTEAGGEGINLQFCHICVNYDLPWNPMRVEQRVGRVYRFGQDKVVQVYSFVTKGTVEDQVQTYFEERLKRAASAIAKVTGEDPEEIKGTLNGQLEIEIDPKEIYKRAMVDGDLNKQTQKEIAEAVERAKHVYEIATQSLFRDVSSYSFENYRRELATDLTLSDLQRFSERFLSMHRRQLQRKAPFVEFLVPDVLRPAELPERYRMATFERDLAIRRTDAEFLAIGHPFVNAMLSFVGGYDFGGLTACREIACAKLSGTVGCLFVFIIRRRVARENGDEYLFEFAPVFVTDDGQVNEFAARVSVEQPGSDSPPDRLRDIALMPLFQTAKEHLEKSSDLWDWADDVEFLGMSCVEFCVS